MPVFQTTDQLLNYLKLQVTASLKETGEYVESEVKNKLTKMCIAIRLPIMRGQEI